MDENIQHRYQLWKETEYEKKEQPKLGNKTSSIECLCFGVGYEFTFYKCLSRLLFIIVFFFEVVPNFHFNFDWCIVWCVMVSMAVLQ